MSTDSDDNLDFNDNIQLFKCVICLDEFQEQDVVNGLVCCNNHFICHNDLKQYVIENIFTQIHKLRENNCAITCPCTDCSSQYNLLDIFIRLEQLEKKRLVNLIEELVFTNERNVKALKDAILDMMTLKCPICKFPVDPLPDACSAILCLSCGCHYCNYCFTGFSSGNREKDRVDSHNHAATHSTAVIKDSFLSPEVVAVGQNEHRQKQIIKCLSIAMKSKGMSVKDNHLVTLALITCYQEVQDLGLDIISLFTNALDNAIGKEKLQKEYVISDYSSEPMGEEDAKALFSQSGTQLANAIITKNDVAIRQILSSYGDNINVNFVENQLGNSIALLATLSDIDWLARILIQKGANPFQGNRQGRNLIYVIIEKGKTELLELIIQMYKETTGFYDRLTSDFTAYNGLHVAIRYNQPNIVKKLVECGFSIESYENEFGYSPLHLAVILGFEWIASGLIYYGANAKAVARNGRTPLYDAADKGNLSLLCQMITYGNCDVNEPVDVNINYRLLHAAASKNQQHIVKKLLDLNADINLSAAGYTPLAVALVNRNSEIALDLIKAGADITIPVNAGRPPLYIAIEKGLTEVVKHLITECNLDVNSKLYDGLFHTYPLNIAITYKQPHLVPILISLGADVNLKDDEGFTPLLAALVKDLPNEAISLIEKGADIYEPNVIGRFPLFVAVERGHTEVIKYLKKEKKVKLNVQVTTEKSAYFPIQVAVIYGQSHIIPLLVSLGAMVNPPNSYTKYTPLQNAVLLNDKMSTLQLLVNGANSIMITRENKSAIYIAIEKGYLDIVRLLFQYSSQPSVNLNAPITSDGSDMNALHVACMFNHPHIVLDLLSLGANIFVLDSNSKSPLDIAIEFEAKDCEDAIKELITRWNITKDKNAKLYSIAYK
eukprot:gene17825-23436_t